jgi:hypothetical protein
MREMMDAKLFSSVLHVFDPYMDFFTSSSVQMFKPSPDDPTFIGTIKSDIFNVPGSSLNIFFGLGGNDFIASSGGNNFIYGEDFTTQSSGNDIISITGGTSSNFNYINTGTGNDVITIAGASTNMIVTGNGSSSIITGSGPSTLDVGPGNKVALFGSGNDKVLYNVGLDGAAKDSFDGGGGTNTLSLAFNTTAQLAKFQTVLGSSVINNFGSVDMQKVFDFSKYESQLGFNLSMKAIHFQNLVLDVNPTAHAYTTTVNVGSGDVPNTPFLLASDTGYLGHPLTLSTISALTSNSSFLKVTADYTAFAPTVGNPPSGQFATFDLTPSGSSSHATLILYNNGNYEIQNLSVLNSVIQAHPGIHLNFSYTDGDGFGGHASNTAQINFNFVLSQDVITAIAHPAPLAAQEDAAFSLTNAQIFADLFTQTQSDPYSLSVTNLPAGLTYNAATGISGSPTVEAGTYLVSVIATNTDPSEPSHSVANNTLTINVADAPDVVTFNGSIGTQGATEGSAFTLATASFFTHTETDDPLVYSATGLAGSGLSINPTTGAITGTPDDPNIGAYLVTVTATNVDPLNGGEHASSNTFTINVADAPDIVSFNGSIATQNVTEGSLVNVVTASFFTHTELDDSLVYSATGLAGSGLSINPTTGAITGTLDDPNIGSYLVTVTATNTDPNNVGEHASSNTFTINVADAANEVAVNAPINLVNTEGDIVNSSVAGLFSSSDDQVSYSVDPASAVQLSALGLSLNSATGAITGTLNAEEGTYVVTIDAHNLDPANSADANVTNTVTFTVSDAANEVSVNAPQTHTNTVGDSINDSIMGLFSSDDSLSYSVDPSSAVQLSALGLSLNSSTGAITGTLSAAAGSYVVTIDAHNLDPANAGDADVSNTVTFTVNNPSPPPDQLVVEDLASGKFYALSDGFNDGTVADLTTDPNSTNIGQLNPSIFSSPNTSTLGIANFNNSTFAQVVEETLSNGKIYALQEGFSLNTLSDLNTDQHSSLIGSLDPAGFTTSNSDILGFGFPTSIGIDDVMIENLVNGQIFSLEPGFSLSTLSNLSTDSHSTFIGALNPATFNSSTMTILGFGDLISSGADQMILETLSNGKIYALQAGFSLNTLSNLDTDAHSTLIGALDPASFNSSTSNILGVANVNGVNQLEIEDTGNGHVFALKAGFDLSSLGALNTDVHSTFIGLINTSIPTAGTGHFV